MLKAVGAILALVVSSVAMASTQTFTLKTPRGVDVEVIAAYPDGASATARVPALVIAPGQGYHMRLPILQQTADKALAAGFAAIRFNWNYYSTDAQNGQPSANLKNEVEDMQTVVNYAKAETRVDTAQMLLAGKSLGTFVSYDLFTRDSSFKGLVLLTPVCSESTDDDDDPLPAPIAVGAQNYPGFADQTRPIVMVLGTVDPNCSVPMLYDFLRSTRGNVATVLVGGNHSLNVSAGTDAVSQARNAANVDAGTAAAVHWINLILGK